MMASPLPQPTVVTEPGEYVMSAEEYHADPVPEGSLSSSGARLLLPPSCPAKFQYESQHGRPPKREFDRGHAAHLEVLGEGPEVVPVRAEDWRTKAAQQQRDAAYAAGAVPLLEHEVEQVRAMAVAIRLHPVAGKLFEPGSGKAERSYFWRDEETLVWRRFRPDWLRPNGDVLLCVDYKTTVAADLNSISASVAKWGYHQQAPWYLDGIRALGLAQQAVFLFVLQEKTPPYLVTVVQLGPDAMRIGAERNRKAIHTYLECRTADHWPAYTDDIETVELPRWATYQHEDARDRGAFTVVEEKFVA